MNEHPVHDQERRLAEAESTLRNAVTALGFACFESDRSRPPANYGEIAELRDATAHAVHAALAALRFELKRHRRTIMIGELEAAGERTTRGES